MILNFSAVIEAASHPPLSVGPKFSTSWNKTTPSGFASLDKANAMTPKESQRTVGVVATHQIHPKPIMPITVMLRNGRDNGNMEKFDAVMAINCVTQLQKG